MSTDNGTTNIVLAALGYIPNRIPAAIFGTLFIAAGIILFVRLVKSRSWWGLCLPIGAIGYGVGYYARIVLVSNQTSKGIFILSTVLISCMPATYLAFNYIVYGRLLMHSLGARYSIIKPSIIGLVFIMSDVLTFLIQAGGASMEINVDKRKLGADLFRIGVIAQAVSFFVFLFFIGWTHLQVRRVGKASSTAAWWKIFYAVYVSSVAIVIRSIFRLIQGEAARTDAINTNETFLYVFDALPLCVAVGVFIPWWPAKYLFQDTLIDQATYHMT
ncbi:RTA1 like protein-domain-containing protein [Mycena floridula]|nr:RTA1 like protein-domain-containing protein [Mycena floridula]